MTRVSLSRLPGDRVLVVDGGTERELAVADLPAYVASARGRRAALGLGRHRAVVSRRCWRPGSGSSAATTCGWATTCCGGRPRWTPLLLEGDAVGALGPARAEHAVRPGAVLRRRHRRAPARRPSRTPGSWPRWPRRPRPRRLGLLLAAESSGALVAAEMTHAGVPWRVDVHERLLTELLGPRPPRGARPRGSRRWSPRSARRSAHPASTPTRGPSCWRALRRAGLEVADTRASSPARARAPGHRAAAALQAARAPVPDQRLGLDRPVGARRPVPAVVPAGRLDHRPVVVQRRRRAVVPGAGPPGGRGRRGLGVRGRRRRPARAARARRDERRPRAGQGGPGADLYQGMVDDGAVASRNDAKLGLLGAMYGATSGESGRMVAGLTRRYPGAFGLVEEAARAGERGQVVRTLLGRGLARPWARRGTATPDDAAGRSRRPGPPPPRVRPLHPQLRRPGHRAPSGRCAGSPTCATGCGAWATPVRSCRARTWSSSCTTRSSCTPRPPSPTRSPTQATEAAATAAGLLFRDLPIDFPLNISIVRSYADAGKPGGSARPEPGVLAAVFSRGCWCR